MAPPLHTVEAFTTPGKEELGTMRMRVLGGWIYMLAPGGTYLGVFVADADDQEARLAAMGVTLHPGALVPAA